MASTPKFVQIPSVLLKTIAEESRRIPKLYYSINPFLRITFWQRLRLLTHLIDRHQLEKGSCLDFGGGSGVMLPTLSMRFRSLTLIDLEARQARLVKQHYGLENVEISEGDIANDATGFASFDAAVAADVLEHFKDLQIPVNALKRRLKPGALLFTSLPTENWLYVFLRKVFRIQKPWDHYHTASEVEGFLQGNGFERIETKSVPLGLPFAPLFLISTWRLSEA